MCGASQRALLGTIKAPGFISSYTILPEPPFSDAACRAAKRPVCSFPTTQTQTLWRNGAGPNLGLESCRSVLCPSNGRGILTSVLADGQTERE